MAVDTQGTPEVAEAGEAPSLQETAPPRLSSRGMQAMRGIAPEAEGTTSTEADGASEEQPAVQEAAEQGTAGPTPELNSAERGAEFQKWAEQNAFDEGSLHGAGRRLTVRPEDNARLDELGDGVGISKAWRQSDSFIDDYGEIYELKAGYENGGIDEDQAYEYSLMQEAGYVNVRQNGQIEQMPVKGVTYIFDSKTGAEANRSVLEPYGFGILYRDEAGKLQQLGE